MAAEWRPRDLSLQLRTVPPPGGFMKPGNSTGTEAAGCASGGGAPGDAPGPDQRRFLEEATRLALESVAKGWGGPFGAVIVKDGAIVGRGQNRVLLTGCPVYHAEIT